MGGCWDSGSRLGFQGLDPKPRTLKQHKKSMFSCMFLRPPNPSEGCVGTSVHSFAPKPRSPAPCVSGLRGFGTETTNPSQKFKSQPQNLVPQRRAHTCGPPVRGPFCDLGLEILQNDVLGASGPILRPGLGHLSSTAEGGAKRRPDRPPVRPPARP